jgi:transposase
MPRRIQLVPHLSVAELGGRHDSAPDSVTRDHWWILYWLAWGESGVRVARRTGYSTKWIGLLARRYNRAGPAAVGDQRQHNRGAAPLLTAEQGAALAVALEGPAPEGGLWSGPKVAAWMSARLGRPVRPQRGWDYLRRCGFTPQRPRPRHAQADAAAQAAFRKASPPACKPSRTRSPTRPSNSGPKTNTAWG